MKRAWMSPNRWNDRSAVSAASSNRIACHARRAAAAFSSLLRVLYAASVASESASCRKARAGMAVNDASSCRPVSTTTAVCCRSICPCTSSRSPKKAGAETVSTTSGSSWPGAAVCSAMVPLRMKKTASLVAPTSYSVSPHARCSSSIQCARKRMSMSDHSSKTKSLRRWRKRPSSELVMCVNTGLTAWRKMRPSTASSLVSAPVSSPWLMTLHSRRAPHEFSPKHSPCGSMPTRSPTMSAASRSAGDSTAPLPPSPIIAAGERNESARSGGGDASSRFPPPLAVESASSEPRMRATLVRRAASGLGAWKTSHAPDAMMYTFSPTCPWRNITVPSDDVRSVMCLHSGSHFARDAVMSKNLVIVTG
mmetsp:Transcript_5085/g.18288  ORF Transcript_5085/g.18288 Transcript_5085/m.18288 type:complete len:365 (-) Transcript_5085:290-1384(-)